VKDLVVFGNGPHFCLGAHLARAEMRCMVDAALDFLPPAATFREDRLELHEAGIFRRPANLPVDFG
jgi:cytochrome P450